jgi:hypothetical protein
MKAILKHVNDKLAKHNLILDQDAVIKEYEQVKKVWDEIIKSIETPVNFLIVGEATVNWSNYFYNPEAPTTSFLTPSHFGIDNKKRKANNKTELNDEKSKLIDLFTKNKILVFDLYPLPLPTFIYDNIKFDCSMEDQYVIAMGKYYKESLIENKIINEKTVIVSRYAKFYKEKKNEKGEIVKNKHENVVIDEKRFEWEIFMKTIDKKINDFKSIYGGYNADPKKVSNVFKKIFAK